MFLIYRDTPSISSICSTGRIPPPPHSPPQPAYIKRIFVSRVRSLRTTVRQLKTLPRPIHIPLYIPLSSIKPTPSTCGPVVRVPPSQGLLEAGGDREFEPCQVQRLVTLLFAFEVVVVVVVRV